MRGRALLVPSRLGVDTKCCVAFGLRKELTEQLHSLVTTQRNFRVLPSPSRRVRILIRVTILSHMCRDPISYVSRSCLSCVTILPQLCHDPASVVSRPASCLEVLLLRLSRDTICFALWYRLIVTQPLDMLKKSKI